MLKLQQAELDKLRDRLLDNLKKSMEDPEAADREEREWQKKIKPFPVDKNFAFCPTGPGGGVDNSCSPTGGSEESGDFSSPPRAGETSHDWPQGNLITRLGETAEGGAYFGIAGLTQYEGGDEYSLKSDAKIADLRNPGIADRIIDETLKDKTLSDDQRARLTNAKGQGDIDYLLFDETPMSEVVKRLGYDAARVMENEDYPGMASSLFVINLQAIQKHKGEFAFCPTGQGGGVDNSCGSTGEAGGDNPKDLPWSGDMRVPSDYLQLVDPGGTLRAPVVVNIDQIRLSEKPDQATVMAMKEHISDIKNDLPPPVVERDADGLYVVDGHSRMRAAQELGYKRVPVREYVPPKSDDFAFCPTGAGGGVDNSCSPSGEPGAGPIPEGGKQKELWPDKAKEWNRVRADVTELTLNGRPEEKALIDETLKDKIGVDSDDIAAALGLETTELKLKTRIFADTDTDGDVTEIITASKIFDQNGNSVGEYRVSFSPDNSEAHLGYAFFDRSIQNHGVTQDLLKRNVELADKMGLDRFTLHADGTIGRYAWAMYGFDFNEEGTEVGTNIENYRDGFLSALDDEDDFQALTEEKRQEIRDEVSDFNHSWEFATLKLPGGIKIGKDLMISDGDWDGQLDLNGESRGIFDAYVNRPKKQKTTTAAKEDSAGGDKDSEIFHRDLLDNEDEMFEIIERRKSKGYAFCPTGEGGGIDNSCSPTGEAGGESGRTDATKSESFKAWFGDSKVTDDDGEPLTVYHGTTFDVKEFDPAKGNAENDWGQGIYFSNNPEDAGENYTSPDDPDLSLKIERRAESIERESDDEISHEDALAQAKKDLLGGAQSVIPAYISMQKPFEVGGDKDTFLDFEAEYEDNDPEKDIIGSKGALADLKDSLVAASSDFESGSIESPRGTILNFFANLESYDGMSASAFVEAWREDEEIGYIQNAEGNLAGGELLRRGLEGAGFDGIIDRTVYERFGPKAGQINPMRGMDEDTAHYIAFRSEQIKSKFNKGTFDPKNPDVSFERDFEFCPTGEGGGVDPTCSPGKGGDRSPKRDAARRKELKVPPAWKDVWLNPDEKGDLQATGIDSKGRTQYLYSAAHSEKAAAEKFSRLREFNGEIKTLRGRIAADLGKDGEDGEAAAVLTLIDKTGFRVGSEKETLGAHKAYGATTLKANHVKIDGDKVQFRFQGKRGVIINRTLHDPALAKLLGPRIEAGGKLFDVSDNQVREYLHSRDGDFKVKDFRTWNATATALKTIQSMNKPRTEKAMKKARALVAKRVARVLGNTPAVALKSYIDPAVWSEWKTK